MNHYNDAATLLARMAAALRERRIRQGDSQQQAAARLGLGLSTYRAMEQGKPGVAVGSWVDALVYIGAPEAFLAGLRPDEDELAALLDEPEEARPSRPRRRVSRRRR